MRKLGMGKTSLLSLDRRLRFVQGTAGSTMGCPFGFQRNLQFCNACLEQCCWIVVASAVENNHRNSAILHEAVAGPHLVGTLLGRLAGRTLQTQGTTHSVFSGLRVAR